MNLSTRAQVITRRTYCRPKNAEGTEFETWEEVISRVINHQRWLWERALTHKNMPEMPLHDITENMHEWVVLNKTQVDELEELRALMLNRMVAVSGRTFWLGGTDIGKTIEASQFNCAALNIETVYDVVDAFWLLLNGAGVGFRPVAGTLTGFHTPIKNLKIIRSKGASTKGREDNLEEWDSVNKTWTISVGDSAIAWAKFIGKLLAGKYSANTLILNFSEIRQAGLRLKNYGWISQGDKGLASASEKIFTILNKRADSLLTATDILDITNLLGTILSTRRSAQIAVYNYEDPEWNDFTEFKNDMFENGNSHRTQSNNSLYFKSRPEKTVLTKLFNQVMSGGGEPGIINGETMSKRSPWASLTNPCGEILLPASGGFCCLTTINLSKFNNNVTELLHAAKLISRANYRQTVVDFRDGILQEKWHLNNEHLHLCGVSMMGVVESKLQPYDYSRLERSITAAGYAMADELSKPYPKQLTTLKPEGCQLPEDYVLTQQGIKTFSELLRESTDTEHPDWRALEGFNALGSGDNISKVYDNGKKKIITFTTKYGIECNSTEQHPWNVEGCGWVEAKDLCLADVLDIDTSCKLKNISVPIISTDSVALGGATQIRVPETMSTDFAWLLGFYFGNGSITNNYIYFVSQYRETLEKVSNIMANEFDIHNTNITKDPVKDMYKITYGSVNFINLLKVNNLLKYTDEGIFASVPEKIRQSLHTVHGFIAGMIDSDGSITKNGVTKIVKISTTHKEFSISLQNTALAAGILFSRSHISRKTTKGYVDFDCTIQSTVKFDNFDVVQNNSIKLSNTSIHSDVKWRHTSRTKLLKFAIQSITVSDKEYQTYGIEVDNSHWYLTAGGVKTHNTISKCYDSTEGMHKPLGKYIFNNVAFSVHDPLVSILKKSNYRVFTHPYDPTAMLATLPVKYDNVTFDNIDGKYVNIESAISQLDRYKMLMQYYCHQNVSCTISYDPSEAKDIVDWIYNNWDNYVAVSFLLRNDPSKTAKDLGYPYLPQEVVDKAEFEEYVKQLLPVDLENVIVDDSILESDCIGGACPIR